MKAIELSFEAINDIHYYFNRTLDSRMLQFELD